MIPKTRYVLTPNDPGDHGQESLLARDPTTQRPGCCLGWSLGYGYGMRFVSKAKRSFGGNEPTSLRLPTTYWSFSKVSWIITGRDV